MGGRVNVRDGVKWWSKKHGKLWILWFYLEKKNQKPKQKQKKNRLSGKNPKK